MCCCHPMDEGSVSSGWLAGSLCSVLPEGAVGVPLLEAVSYPWSTKLFWMAHAALMQLGERNGGGALFLPTTWACLVFAVLPPAQHHCAVTGGLTFEASPTQAPGAS